MKVPLKWLKDYVKITLPVTELAEGLTATGLEVGEIINTGGGWENVIIGEVTDINPHPNADRLKLATVNLGKEQETVVCGASNLNKGDKIAFARVGARLIHPETRKTEELKAAKIRGVESRGMVCSERELGISDSHEGILVLAGEAEVGTALADFMGDTVLDIDVTANRPDCLSVVGIAREAAAICGEKVNIPKIIYEEAGEPIEKQASVEIIDSELCPRYCASLITDVKIKESPAWLQERLIACGQRPISNIVDITNYIMLEYGQPLHSFDYEKLKGGKIVVQRAKDGEQFYTLDGEERKLTGNMLTIRDGERAVAIAGVMGGLNSDVTESTTSILLEAASFKATSLHHTSRYLGLTSEASMRFERDIGAGLTIPALKHATKLIAELGGGKVAKGIIDVYPGKKDPEPITITTEKTERLIGVAYNSEQIVKALTALGIECKAEGAKVTATAPYWRSDIKIEEDLIEEVARFYGYDRIPLTLLGQEIPRQDPSPEINLKKTITTSLVGMGFQEIMNYSLTSLEMINKVASETDTIKPLCLTNPMTAEQEYLRPSLRGNLLSTLAANRRHEEGGIALFEVGKAYVPRKNDLPDEQDMLCGVMNGDRAEGSWLGHEGACDFYDVKGVMEGLFRQLGIDISFENSSDEGLHPARQASVIAKNYSKKVKLGVIGEVHPKTADAFEIEGTVCLFEISIRAMLPLASQVKMYKPIPRFPSTVRDMALVVDTSVTNQQILDIIKGFRLISAVELFDVYSGKQVAEGKKSLAYRLVYQAPDHTLTDEEVNKVQEQLTARLAKELGATLRK